MLWRRYCTREGDPIIPTIQEAPEHSSLVGGGGRELRGGGLQKRDTRALGWEGASGAEATVVERESAARAVGGVSRKAGPESQCVAPAQRQGLESTEKQRH